MLSTQTSLGNVIHRGYRRNQTLHVSWGPILQDSELCEGFYGDHGNPHLPAVSHLLSIITRMFAQLRSSIFLQMMISANSLSPGCNPVFQVSKFKPFLGSSSEMQEGERKYFQNDTNGI